MKRALILVAAVAAITLIPAVVSAGHDQNVHWPRHNPADGPGQRYPYVVKCGGQADQHVRLKARVIINDPADFDNATDKFLHTFLRPFAGDTSQHLHWDATTDLITINSPYRGFHQIIYQWDLPYSSIRLSQMWVKYGDPTDETEGVELMAAQCRSGEPDRLATPNPEPLTH